VTSLAGFDTVRVVSLTGPPEDYLALSTSERPPRVGDLGTVTYIAPGLGGGGTRYAVESGHEDGRADWLADFSAAELAFVARPPARR